MQASNFAEKGLKSAIDGRNRTELKRLVRLFPGEWEALKREGYQSLDAMQLHKLLTDGKFPPKPGSAEGSK